MIDANVIIAEIVERYQNLKRDEGAFPLGDHRTARSEQFLWHAIQSAKQWLKTNDSSSQTVTEKP